MTQKKQKSPKENLSKQLIITSLLRLMKEKPFPQITITELASCAAISRRTFYRHFASTNDVLHHIINEITMHFTEYFLKQKSKNLETIIFIYFSYWNKRKQFLMLLKNNNLLFLLLECFTPNVQEKIYREKANEEKRNLAYAYYFTCGGIWNMLVKWLEEGGKLSPREMQKIGSEILKHVE